jgi:hypothetical protein
MKKATLILLSIVYLTLPSAGFALAQENDLLSVFS